MQTMRSILDTMADALPTRFRMALRAIRASLMPTLGVAAVNISAVIICIAAAWALWIILLPFPVQSVTTIRVEPTDHVIDRAKNVTLAVERKIIMQRAANIQVIRMWIDQGGGVTSTLDDYIYLEKGENIRTRVRIPPPTSLNPGKHRYRVILRHCPPIGVCGTLPLEDIEVLIVGAPPVDLDRSFQEHRF